MAHGPASSLNRMYSLQFASQSVLQLNMPLASIVMQITSIAQRKLFFVFVDSLPIFLLSNSQLFSSNSNYLPKLTCPKTL